ncbi:MAG: ABC transporter permease [Cyclobacteriaceae bacterium]
MDKVWIIVRREFLNRVQKKSFLIATILLPLIFPSIIALLVYFSQEQKKNALPQVIHYVDEGDFIDPKPLSDDFDLRKFDGGIDDAKKAFSHSNDFGLLYIPPLKLSDPKGIQLFTKQSPSPSVLSKLESEIETQIRSAKLLVYDIPQHILDSLNSTSTKIESIKVSESGREESNNADVLFGIGMTGGILIYIFIFMYGSQIMQGVIEEKTSKVVEIIISTVRPFQLMMGKIIGLAAVGLLQFSIWIVLITVLSSVVLNYFGFEIPQKELTEQTVNAIPADQLNGPSIEIIRALAEINVVYVIGHFLFYFVGGYLLYGALFAAVGSAVDSPAEAQQFIFPITIPMLISYFALFLFILDDPYGPISVWLSIIPFTSPIAMMGRVGFGVPLWQSILSMVCLVIGFTFTTWIAARIYRIGILMHGSKVNYRVLAKWFMMKA